MRSEHPAVKTCLDGYQPADTRHLARQTEEAVHPNPGSCSRPRGDTVEIRTQRSFALSAYASTVYPDASVPFPSLWITGLGLRGVLHTEQPGRRMRNRKAGKGQTRRSRIAFARYKGGEPRTHFSP